MSWMSECIREKLKGLESETLRAMAQEITKELQSRNKQVLTKEEEWEDFWGC